MDAAKKGLTDQELEALWEELRDVPIDEDEALDEDFRHFPRGTDRVDIWHWFDEQHSKGLVWLMHPAERARIEREMAG
jgi:hypothetical protein